MGAGLFVELGHFVGFGEDEERALQGLHPIVAPHAERLAHLFYERLLLEPGARQLLEQGESVPRKLEGTLVRWLDEVFRGPHDEAYYDRRAKIGSTHVGVGIPQHYMFGAMCVLRSELSAILAQHFDSDARALHRAHSVVDKALDLELAVMLHSYRKAMLAKQATAERLATYGQLAGTIGHELRNPLGVIEVSTYLLKQAVAGNQKAETHVSRIDEQLGVAREIISKMFDLIHERPMRPTPFSLAKVLEASVAALRWPDTLRLELVGLEAQPTLWGDAAQLRQVFVNLLENAAQACGDTGEIHVEAKTEAGFVSVHVRDSGPGVDPSVRARLFEPLVTTKNTGTGLGLALVKRIVERHGGSVVCLPAAQGGACFAITLPIKE